MNTSGAFSRRAAAPPPPRGLLWKRPPVVPPIRCHAREGDSVPTLTRPLPPSAPSQAAAQPEAAHPASALEQACLSTAPPAPRRKSAASRAPKKRIKAAPVFRVAVGVDYGRVRTGLAVSAGGIAPRPLPVLKTAKMSYLTAREVIAIAQREGADGIVVGIPVKRRGHLRKPKSDTAQANYCRRFALVLMNEARLKHIRVVLVDERNTTQDAWAVMEASGNLRGARERGVDSVAASLILSAYYSDPTATSPPSYGLNYYPKGAHPTAR